MMNSQDKTRKDLIKELQELQMEYDSLKTSYEKYIIECKRVEKALRESEMKLKTLFEVLPIGVSILDAERNVAFVNPAMERIVNLTKDGFIRGDYKSRKYLRPDGTQMPEEEFASVRAIREQQAIHDVETGILIEDGHVIWTNVNAAPVAFSDWKVVIITTDITMRKRAKEALRVSEENYRILIDSMGEGVGIVNDEENFVFANPAAEKIFGVGPGRLVGTALNRYISPENLEFVIKHTNERRKGISSTYEHEIILSSGEKKYIIITATPKIDNNGKFLGTFAIFRDITERKLTEETIRNLAKFPSENPDPVLRIDRNGRLLYANEASYKFLTWNLQIGKKTPSVLQKIIAEAMKEGIGKTINTKHNQRVISFKVVPVVEAGYANLYGQDITKQL